MNIEPDHPYYIDHDDSGDGRYDDSNAAEQGLAELYDAISKGDLPGITAQLKKLRRTNPLDDPAAQREYENWLDSIDSNKPF